MKTAFDKILSEVLQGESELSEDVLAILYQEIEAFRKGGEGFTFEEWRHLEPVTKMAFIDVGNKLRDQDAARIAYFTLNPFEMNKVLFGEDAAVKAALGGEPESRKGPIMDLKTGQMVEAP